MRNRIFTLCAAVLLAAVHQAAAQDPPIKPVPPPGIPTNGLFDVGLRGLGPTRAVSYTYAIPALAVLMGAFFLDEPITVWLAVGGALILGGVALAQRSRAG